MLADQASNLSQHCSPTPLLFESIQVRSSWTTFAQRRPPVVSSPVGVFGQVSTEAAAAGIAAPPARSNTRESAANLGRRESSSQAPTAGPVPSRARCRSLTGRCCGRRPRPSSRQSTARCCRGAAGRAAFLDNCRRFLRQDRRRPRLVDDRFSESLVNRSAGQYRVAGIRCRSCGWLRSGRGGGHRSSGCQPAGQEQCSQA